MPIDSKIKVYAAYKRAIDGKLSHEEAVRVTAQALVQTEEDVAAAVADVEAEKREAEAANA